ncbi:hypothetical protein ACFSTA_12575 [Ornithinibacillus salinisoli]|uniref:DUF2974 domain-containing protein n=1 Tax=Ornithinibacillus salinisoli TaxID=1848459 RepID=A0ABW4W4Q1_9BACI
MKKKKGFKYLLLSMVAIISVSFFGSVPANAGYSDNPNALYYQLSSQVYKVNGYSSGERSIQNQLTGLYGNKFEVIDSFDSLNNPDHPAGELNSGLPGYLNNTGFQAVTVVAERSRKLYIAFAGTNPDSLADLLTSLNIMQNDNPGQLYHAQLYLNYIYNTYPEYRNYKWYFTGHSLGGYIASKTYLDIRSANWLNSGPKFKHGGPVKKTSISGVYTFNALPIPKFQVPSVQWNANKNGVYDSAIKNMYIQNEWLNGVYDMHYTVMDYFGTKGAINTGIPYYSNISYDKHSDSGYGIVRDLVGYYSHAKDWKKSVVDSHGIANFSKWVSN